MFGSLARGELREDSDIDMVVEFKDEKSLLDLVSLKLELEAELGKEVDVLTYNALNPNLKKALTLSTAEAGRFLLQLSFTACGSA